MLFFSHYVFYALICFNMLHRVTKCHHGHVNYDFPVCVFSLLLLLSNREKTHSQICWFLDVFSTVKYNYLKKKLVYHSCFLKIQTYSSLLVCVVHLLLSLKILFFALCRNTNQLRSKISAQLSFYLSVCVTNFRSQKIPLKYIDTQSYTCLLSCVVPLAQFY